MKVTVDTDDYLEIIKNEIMERMVGKTWNSEVKKTLEDVVRGMREDVESEDPDVIGKDLMQHAAKNGVNEIWGFFGSFVDSIGLLEKAKSGKRHGS